MRLRSRQVTSSLAPCADETYENSVERVSRRELKRSQRVHPVLIENILLASILHEKGNASKFSLPFHSIVELCSFAQRTKWLCPWGTQFYDEVHRPQIRTLPKRAEVKFLALEFDEHEFSELSRNDVIERLSNASSQWERVYLYDQGKLDCLEHLYKHPCEELHIAYADDIRRKDVLNILRCKTLRVLNLECVGVPRDFLIEFAKLPNLEVIHDMDIGPGPLDMVAGYRLFPNIHSLSFDVMDEPARDEEVSAMVDIINERRHTLRYVRLMMSPVQAIMDALTMCPNLEWVEIIRGSDFDDTPLYSYFGNPIVQKRLRHIILEYVDYDEDFYELLAKCTNLCTFQLRDSSITGPELADILLANAKTIRFVDVMGSRDVCKKVLDAIEQCSHLEWFDLRRSLIRGAIQRYKRNRRRNHQAIWDHDISEPITSDEEDIYDV